jgi:predicted Zn-ribbon and HTH transcriptional regulator
VTRWTAGFTEALREGLRHVRYNHQVSTAAELRASVERARTDADVVAYSYRRATFTIQPAACPACGASWRRAGHRVSWHPCACPAAAANHNGHTVLACDTCGGELADPPHPGMGSW